MPAQIPIEKLLNMKFGNLKIIEEVEQVRDIRGRSIRNVKCQCDCGKILIRRLPPLLKGNTKRCPDCRKIFYLELNRNRIYNKLKHGKCHEKIYQTYHDMRQRCLNPINKRYKDYGGRGIKICEEWLNDFMSFYNWSMANGYKEELTIDRTNNDGNYEPGNCQWITLEKNSGKTRKRILSDEQIDNIINSYKSENVTYAELAKKYCVAMSTIEHHLLRAKSIR